MLLMGNFRLRPEVWNIATTPIFEGDYMLSIFSADVPDNILSANMYKVFTKGVKSI